MNYPPFGTQQPTPPPPPETQQEAGARMVRVKAPSVRPIVTYAILAITVLFYLLQMLTNAGIAQGPFLALGRLMFGSALFDQMLTQGGWSSDLLVLLGAKISPLIRAGQYWRLFTPMLLHASLIHIGFNMYALYAFGPNLERFYGHWRFLALYVLGGFAGNVLSFVMTPAANPSIGASTAIFGLVAAEGVFFYQNRELFGAQARSALTNVVMVVIINLGLGLSSSGIDNWGHLGGLLGGAAFAWFAGPRLEVGYNHPNYELIDQRSPFLAWLAAVVVFFVIAGITILYIANS